MHLLEEVGELFEIVLVFRGEHHHEDFNKIGEELADVITHLLALASEHNLDMFFLFTREYPSGCNVCLKSPCECTFRQVAEARVT